MATSKKYLNYVLEQLSGLKDISHRMMMGEYIIYYNGRILGGIHDNRFLVKPVKSAVKLMPDALFESPYKGAKEMILVNKLDDKEFLNKLVTEMYDELPEPKKRKKWFEI